MFSRLAQKTLSIFLIALLFLSQTVELPWFRATAAARDEYHDIVAIVVDADTYRSLTPEIKRYASDIQGYLGSTRTSLYIVPANTPPEAIATELEGLYYDGDGKSGQSLLVGAVFLGNVPIPMVTQDEKSYPSIYPYIDFRNKRFLYNQLTKRYEKSASSYETTDVDIWHGVINPALGKTWDRTTDIPKIEAFLDKTHEFYTRSGKFAPMTTSPRVFYYDGYNESAALDFRSLYQYILSMRNMENFAYKRFSKYLLSDINESLKAFDAQNDAAMNDTLSALGVTPGSNSLDTADIMKLPDIQTVQQIRTLTKKFYEVINAKTLGDEQLFVHNAGRYTSGSIVRVDQ